MLTVYISTYPLESLYKVTRKKHPIEQLINTYFIHLEKTIAELSEQRSNQELASICHRIKGSSSNTGAKVLSQKFQSLETALKAGECRAPLNDWLKELEPTIESSKKEFELFLSSLS